MAKEPDYQQAFYDIIRAMEILALSLTSKETLEGNVPEHRHVASDENPRTRALDHLRSAAHYACLEGFTFDYVPFGKDTK